MLIPLNHFKSIEEEQLETEYGFQLHLQDLSPIMPRFFVPPLEDKPQNPIMDSLRIEWENINCAKSHASVRGVGGNKKNNKPVENEKEVLTEIKWEEAALQKKGVRNGLLSWDRLRFHPNPPTCQASRTAFLSEQDEFVFTCARSHLQPRLHDPTTMVITTTSESELVSCLKSTVLGISSRLHTWDSELESFVQAGVGVKKRTGILMVEGKDEVVSESFVARFIRIGMILRRLEVLLSSLRTRSAKEGPTIHALAHSLSTTLDYIRGKLVECPPTQQEEDEKHISENGQLYLVKIWSCYAPYEDLLVALGELYGRSESLKPHEYLPLDSSPIPLLSLIYDHVSLHFDRQSSHLVRSVMAFILSSTSQGYIQHVAHSIGFGGGQQLQLKRPRLGATARYPAGGGGGGNVFEDDEGEEEEDIFDLLDPIETIFPSFFPLKMTQLLPSAQKSLVLLKIAQPDHALLLNNGGGTVSKAEVRWLWRTDEVEAAWMGVTLPLSGAMLGVGGNLVEAKPELLSEISYNPELSAFRLFDFEPGVGSSNSVRSSSITSPSSLHSFISSFPPSLPSLTPTLTSLTSLTFQPLTDHASTLSRTLLAIFVDQPGKLHFRTHLDLLRNFLLVSKPGFKAKLVNALFDDSGAFGVENGGGGGGGGGGGTRSAHALSVRAVRQRQREGYMRRRPHDGKLQRRRHEGDDNGHDESLSKMPWAVGLAPHLLERETWPPVGADLSFFLRTVIVDSLDWGEEDKAGDAVVLEEAEWRLGFAIRDLPMGTGKEKWLDPLSIEALDFLYMDYKPPRPLEVLISPEILPKYQRMFAFILRLLRVENALKSLFRMSTHRTHATCLFPTLTKSRQLLLHFRFVAQAFVSSLSGYVFDTVIAGNFDPFLARLSSSSSSSSSSPTNETSSSPPSFSDVFELAQCHSALLDDILSACLLRSGQKGVGDLLRQSMEIVLEFTIVVGELHRQRLEEYQASAMIEELYRRFCVKMTMLTKVLKGLVDKGPNTTSTSKVALQGYYVVSGGGSNSNSSHRPTGGLEAVYHLLLRLDLTDWWSSRKAIEVRKEE